MGKPRAIGFIRREVSGIRQVWHEEQIRSLAKRYGYDLTKIIVFGDHTVQPDCRLRVIAEQRGVDAIITPALDHLGGRLPTDLVCVVDVITITPTETYARWANGEIPNSMGPR